jgi:hypothetical protein
VGLAEKQALATFKEKQLSALVEALKKTTGTDLAVTVDEASFTVNAIGKLQFGFFDRFNLDLAAICKDNLGKEAIKESLKSVVIKNTTEAKKIAMDLSGGVFTVTGKWDGSPGDDLPGKGDYQKYIMTKL